MKNFILLILILVAQNIHAQKHTFRNNTSECKNINTGVTQKSESTDAITIENLGGGKYKLIDSNGSMVMKYSHSEDFPEGTMYIYDIIGKQYSKLKSGKKLSDLAKGIPGKFAIDSDDVALVCIYRLNN
jgi:hypothetical protein